MNQCALLLIANAKYANACKCASLEFKFNVCSAGHCVLFSWN